MDNTDHQPCFLITVPRNVSNAIRAKSEGKKEHTASTVGEITSNEPYVISKSHNSNFTFSVKIEKDQQKYVMKGEQVHRTERILTHERTTEDKYMVRAQEEQHLVPKKRKPENISFKGSVTHSCKITQDTNSKESLMEMGRRMEAKRQKLIAQRTGRRAKGMSVRAQPRPERNQGVVTTNPTSGMSATQVSRQEGMREQYEVKLDDKKMRKILIQLFREQEKSFVPDAKYESFPGLKLKQGIMIHRKLKHQKEKWIKNILQHVANYHRDAGLQHQRWTLKTNLK